MQIRLPKWLGGRSVKSASRALGAATTALGYGGGFREEMSPFAEKSANEAYRSNPFAYRAVETRVVADAGVGLIFRPRGQPDANPIEPSSGDGRMVEPNLPHVLLREPNIYEGGMSTMANFWRNLNISGVAALHFVKRPSVEGGLMEVHCIPSSMLNIEVSEKTGQPTKYVVGWDGHEKTSFPVGDKGECELFVQFRYNPDRPFRGLSPMEVGNAPIQTVREANNHNVRLVKNGMSVGGVIAMGGKGEDGRTGMSQDELDAMQKRLQIQGAGARNNGKWILVDGEMVFHEMGGNLRDMAFKDLTDFHARQILLIWGVPPQLLGISTEANAYANYQQASRSFFENVISPDVDDFCCNLSAYLIRNGYGLEVRPDKETISVYRDLRAERMKTLSEVDYMTMDEKRDYFGMPPLTPEQKKELEASPPKEKGADPKKNPEKPKSGK